MRYGASLRELSERDVDPDPIREFGLWLDEATSAGIALPHAMAVATAARDATPSVRMLLLRGFDQRGFVFFTNYASQKGRELAENDAVALVWYWDVLERQVRVTGQAQRVSQADSQAYFATRPLGSRIAASVSRQGQVISGREPLERAYAQLERRYANGDVPLPPDWGGYRVAPEAIEFWQGRPNRLHDRLLYTRDLDGAWRIERLSP